MVFNGFWLVSMVFRGGFLVFHGFWLVSMVFQGIFMAFHGLWLVSMVFQGSFNKKNYLQNKHIAISLRPPAHLLSRGNPDPKSKQLKGQLYPPVG